MKTGGTAGHRGAVDGKRRFRARMLLIGFLLGSAVALFFGSPLSRVTNIRVEGTHSLSPVEVEQAAGISRGTWWFRVKPGEVADRIKKVFPLAADVQVHLGWTGTMTISVTEKGVVAVFPAGGAWYRLLDDGTALDVVRPGESIGMPLVTADGAAPVTLGKPVQAAVQACKQLAKLSPDLRAQLAEVHLGDPDVWTVYTTDHYELHVPDENFAGRIQWFPKIRDQVKDKGPGEIWLTDPFRYIPFSGGKGSR
ncbi:MAG: FtsQ-type POTRA domain-containing protein [Kyrpidia sp.]|nr:FtsQ-type POTRA domain-containing protein [Kyrpidia sp.]